MECDEFKSFLAKNIHLPNEKIMAQSQIDGIEPWRLSAAFQLHQ